MTPTARGRARPSPLISPRRRERLPPRDSDDEARYVVTVRSAKNLKRAGFRGLTNPYCQLNVGRQGPFTTDVIFDSTNPCWEDKRQTFEFREGKGSNEEKLSLACFNSGDVPELIGRLNVALSHADHKVISLPMFRKDLGGSQIWSGSVEIELHYIPAVDSSPISAGGLRNEIPNSPTITTTPSVAPVPSPASISLATSFAKTTISYPEKPGSSGRVVDETDSVLQALSPGAAKGAEASGSMWARAGSSLSPARARKARATKECGDVNRVAMQDRGEGVGGGTVDCGFWKAFFAGVLFSVMAMVASLWVMGGDPMLLMMSGAQSVAMGVRVLEETTGRQTFIAVKESNTHRLADRHVVVLVGDHEVCRGGVPAPSPPTMGSKRAFDSYTSEFDVGGDGVGGGIVDSKRRAGGSALGDRERQYTTAGGASGHRAACGHWCALGSFMRRLAAPLYAARRVRTT